jgi:hypothetical protein
MVAVEGTPTACGKPCSGGLSGASVPMSAGTYVRENLSCKTPVVIFHHRHPVV